MPKRSAGKKKPKTKKVAKTLPIKENIVNQDENPFQFEFDEFTIENGSNYIKMFAKPEVPLQGEKQFQIKITKDEAGKAQFDIKFIKVPENHESATQNIRADNSEIHPGDNEMLVKSVPTDLANPVVSPANTTNVAESIPRDLVNPVISPANTANGAPQQNLSPFPVNDAANSLDQKVFQPRFTENTPYPHVNNKHYESVDLTALNDNSTEPQVLPYKKPKRSSAPDSNEYNTYQPSSEINSKAQPQMQHLSYNNVNRQNSNHSSSSSKQQQPLEASSSNLQSGFSKSKEKPWTPNGNFNPQDNHMFPMSPQNFNGIKELPLSRLPMNSREGYVIQDDQGRKYIVKPIDDQYLSVPSTSKYDSGKNKNGTSSSVIRSKQLATAPDLMREISDNMSDGIHGNERTHSSKRTSSSEKILVNREDTNEDLSSSSSDSSTCTTLVSTELSPMLESALQNVPQEKQARAKEVITELLDNFETKLIRSLMNQKLQNEREFIIVQMKSQGKFGIKKIAVINKILKNRRGEEEENVLQQIRKKIIKENKVILEFLDQKIQFENNEVKQFVNKHLNNCKRVIVQETNYECFVAIQFCTEQILQDNLERQNKLMKREVEMNLQRELDTMLDKIKSICGKC